MDRGKDAVAVETESSGPSGTPPAPAARRRRKLPESTALVAVLVGLIVFFSITSEYFFVYANLINIMQNVAVIGIIAVPSTVLLISGEFDLSVGSAAGIIGMTMAVAATATTATTTPYGLGLSIGLALVAALLVAALVGFLNGFFVTVVGISGIITTLGTLAIWRGLTKVLGDGQTIRVSGFGALGISRPVLGIPLPVILFAIVIAGFILMMKYTVYGRSMYAIGANPVAARLSGIPVKRYVFIGFMLSAAMTALAGLIRLSQLGAASVNAGLGFELMAVTAVILGGTSLAGGRGTIQGTVLAVFLIGILSNGLIQLNVPSFWIEFAQGALLLAAVAADRVRIGLAARTA